MRILLTGATGFVGRYAHEELTNQGYEVICLVRNKERAKAILPKANLFQADLYNSSDIKTAVSEIKPEVVIHLVGILYERGRDTFTEVHLGHTKRLLDACLNSGVRRFVLMSSLGTSPKAPSLYHQTKFLAETEVIQSGIEYIILRPSIILGPEQRLLKDLWSLTRFLRLLAIPEPSYLFQPIDVRDIKRALAGAVRISPPNKPIELCGPSTISIKCLFSQIIAGFNRRVIILPAPKKLLELSASLSDTLRLNLPISKDQLLMMWKDNICGLEENVISDGVRFLTGQEPIPLKESIKWSLEGFSPT
ncbi:MAG: NAD(P)H-binding protein [Aquificaceae bacterium]|nr:NAD(P)H-binding protein [Aquificaceae bacterium]MDW8237076.1 NAD(P)H-binding protein [Aquificaceae bacterium]